uniref:SLC26A/SulP transporter domain-containing protein n=1 Tax=Acrobeloides nanus TaxID=290746 RepID=A0A914CH16_9BILA
MKLVASHDGIVDENEKFLKNDTNFDKMEIMNQLDFEESYPRICQKPKKKIFENLSYKSVAESGFKKFYNFVPIIEWLPKYDWKANIKYDILGGISDGIMHIPQGMAYASLAGVPPIHGVYASFFVTIAYLVFGTSRHISVGTFAVASMMTGAVRYRLIPDVSSENLNSSTGSSTLLDVGYPVTPLMLTASLTLGVGIIQVT